MRKPAVSIAIVLSAIVLSACASQQAAPITPVTIPSEPVTSGLESPDGASVFVETEPAPVTPVTPAPVEPAPATPDPEQAASLPSVPSRQAVAQAMREADPFVQSCANGSAHVVQVRMEFNSSGWVTSVQSNAPPDLEVCLHAKVADIRLPPFSRPTFTISYPFRLR